MYKTVCCMLAGFIAGVCAADTLDGREITLKAGAQASAHAPVALPYEGEAPDTSVAVFDEEADKSYPVTIRDGQFVFILESLEAQKKHTCQVKVLDKAEAPGVVIKEQEDADVLEVYINGEHFTNYNYSNENKKPFLWPVYAEGGVTITRNWPMGEVEINSVGKDSDDHVHHRSIWTSWGDLNGVDCWGEGGGSGFQHSEEVTWGVGDAYGWIHAKNVWQDKDHQPVIDEEREYRFYAGPAGARIFDVAVTFTASQGAVKFGDTKEGGILAFRIRPEIEARGQKGGTIVNAEGAKGERGCWGKPSTWTDYFGEVADVGVRGIAVFDHPTNLRHPTCWHIRGYGLNGANCFGLSYFTEREQKRQGEQPLNGDYLLDAGKSLTFKYRVLIHSGDAEAVQVADRYADYASPPEAQWAE